MASRASRREMVCMPEEYTADQFGLTAGGGTHNSQSATQNFDLQAFWPQDWPIDALVRCAMLLLPFVAIVVVTLSGFLAGLPFRTGARVEAVRSPAF
jgi:hypothetical protein